MGLHQTKKLLHNEGNHQWNETATEWEKTSTNQVTDKRHLSKIWKELTTLNGRKKKRRLKKWAEDLNKYFAKEDIQRPTGTWKIAPQLYPSGKYKSNHNGRSPHIWRSAITKWQETQVLVRMWRKESPAAGNVNWCSHYEKQDRGVSKINGTVIWSSNSNSGYSLDGS